MFSVVLVGFPVFVVDEAGNITDMPLDESIEIGSYKKPGDGTRQMIYQQKHRIKTGLNHIVLKLPQRPDEAGVDPRHLLIDADLSDNMRLIK